MNIIQHRPEQWSFCSVRKLKGNISEHKTEEQLAACEQQQRVNLGSLGGAEGWFWGWGAARLPLGPASVLSEDLGEKQQDWGAPDGRRPEPA